MCLSATFLYYKDTMRDCVKGLSKVEVKTIHFSSLILRAHPLLTESNQVGIARFNLGKSNLGFQSPSCPSCVWKWLPWRIPPAISQARGKTDQSVPPWFFLQMRETITFFFQFAGNTQLPQPFEGDRKWPRNEAGQLPQHHAKHVPEN